MAYQPYESSRNICKGTVAVNLIFTRTNIFSIKLSQKSQSAHQEWKQGCKRSHDSVHTLDTPCNVIQEPYFRLRSPWESLNVQGPPVYCQDHFKPSVIFFEVMLSQICYFYKMVTQNISRTHEGKQVVSEKKNPICYCSRSNQMP